VSSGSFSAHPRYTFPYIRQRFGERSALLEKTGIFWLGSGLALLSALVVLLFFPDIKPDYMVDEDRLFREYLVENGVDISMMGMKPDKEKDSTTVTVEETEK
jgi:hypothetical protein